MFRRLKALRATSGILIKSTGALPVQMELWRRF
jgi:hypothetical protein